MYHGFCLQRNAVWPVAPQLSRFKLKRGKDHPMTRSIFDPDGGETERSGSRFGPEDAQNRSHIPRETVDGRVSDEERADAEAAPATEDVDERSKTNPDADPRDEERL
jgi:hypothetical protein